MKIAKKLTFVILAAFISASSLMTGCNETGEESSYVSPESKVVSQTEKSTEEPESAVISESSAESVVENSEPKEESSEPENSQPDEESSEIESSEEIQESENSEESSEAENFDEKSAAEMSTDGYQFDDEQIVKDYHNATEFTNNEEFNKIFSGNAIDAEYKKELITAQSGNQMRSITVSYTTKWMDLVSVVYKSLEDLLQDRPEEYEKLLTSQDEWINSVGTVESSFYAEASDAGTEGLLAADAAIMNYFKGRASVLLEQIYELNGSIQLSDYGL